MNLQSVIDDYVASIEEEREPDGYWHPSGMFGCARKAVYEKTGAEKEPFTTRTKRTFRLGHMLHELVQTALETDPSVEEFYSEIEVIDEVRKQRGHADGLVKIEGGEWALLELKSIGSYGFKALTEPKQDHVDQAKTYATIIRRDGYLLADGTKMPPIPELERIIFGYVSKDNLDVKQYNLVLTPSDTQELDYYVDRLNLHVFEGTLPRRLDSVTTPTGRVSKTRPWLCGYCPFQTQCYSKQEPEGVS